MAAMMAASLAACGGSKPAETTAAPAADKTEAAADGETKAEAAAESGSAWEPSTTVSIVVPAGAGGNTDLSARVFAQYAKELTGHDFIVVNASGAAGSVAANQVLAAAADGHTFLYGHNLVNVANIAGVTDYNYTAFKLGPTFAKDPAQQLYVSAEKYADLNAFIEDVLAHAEYVLSQTPEMLPVLKEAGVVDSGGQGLLTVLQGAYDAFLGKEIDLNFEMPEAKTEFVRPSKETEKEIKFGYCTEFIIMLENPLPDEAVYAFKDFLNGIGDSIVLVADDELVKVHVHTNDPGKAISKALTYGQLTRMKIDNMREEHQERLIKNAEKIAAQQAEEDKKRKEAAKQPPKENGFIAVSIGEGIKEIFQGLGVDYLIEGGQTMNPSTEDMLTAIEKVNAKNIFILPNNKNIILAANQAQSLTEDKDIIVIPTKTVPQGITAIINYMPEADVDTNINAMNEGIKAVKTGQVTYAVRDTRIDDKEIHEGDIMGIGDAGILAVGQSVEETTKEMLADLVDEDTELISLYYGQDVLAEDAERFSAEIEELYPDVDVDVHSGGQPIYYYVLSVE